MDINAALPWAQLLIPQAANLLAALLAAQASAEAVRKAEAELAAAGATAEAIASFKLWAGADIHAHVAAAIEAVADFAEKPQ